MLQREGASPPGHSTHSMIDKASLYHKPNHDSQQDDDGPLPHSAIDDQPLKNQNGQLLAETEEHVPLHEQTLILSDDRSDKDTSTKSLNGERTQKGYLTYHSSR